MSGNALDTLRMREALRMARDAAERGEVPIGAVLASEEGVFARASNATLRLNDPTAHAEILALRRGAKRLRNHRLTGLTLYVTLEPCLMCLGAMVQARIARCVFGATDPKVGATSVLSLPGVRRGINHRFPVIGGCEALTAAELLQRFFRARRTKP